MLSITDDGRGISASTSHSRGMGLRIMKYRAEMIGAVLTIGPAKGGLYPSSAPSRIPEEDDADFEKDPRPHR